MTAVLLASAVLLPHPAAFDAVSFAWRWFSRRAR